MSSGAWESEVCRTQDWGWQDQMLSSGSVAHTYFCYPTSPCNNTKEEVIEMVKPGPLWRFTAGSQETRLTNSNKTRFQLDIKEEQLPIRMVKHWNKGPEMWGNLGSRRFSRPDWKKAWASWSKFIAAAVLSRTLEETFWGPFQHELHYDFKFKGAPVLKINQQTKINVFYWICSNDQFTHGCGDTYSNTVRSGPDILSKYSLQCNSSS